MPRLLPALLLGLTLVGCQKASSSERITIDLGRPATGTPVVTFRGGALTTEEIDRQFSTLPPMVRMRYQSPALKKDYVEGLARVELLSREAVRLGLQNDPDVVETVKKVLAQKAQQQILKQDAPDPTDADVQTYYDAHQAEFQRPEQIQLQDLFLSAEAKSDPARRKARGALADKLLAKARALKPDDERGFGELVKANSDDQLTKPLGGDLRPLRPEDLQTRLGAEVANAAKGLTNPGEISSVVATDTGFHILRLKAHIPARVQTLPEVKGQIRSRMAAERRNTASEALMTRLKNEMGYKLDEAALAQLNAAPPPAPAGAAGLPVPTPLGAPPPSTK
jgi:parvulin-like peptidyl-prolyl isomerase